MKVVINRCYGGFDLSEKAESILLQILGEDAFNEMERHDPVFVSLVEKMGNDVNGMCAKLEIVEVEDGLDYDIKEYDGYESISPYISVTPLELSNGLSEEKLRLLKHTNIIKLK